MEINRNPSNLYKTLILKFLSNIKKVLIQNQEKVSQESSSEGSEAHVYRISFLQSKPNYGCFENSSRQMFKI